MPPVVTALSFGNPCHPDIAQSAEPGGTVDNPARYNGGGRRNPALSSAQAHSGCAGLLPDCRRGVASPFVPAALVAAGASSCARFCPGSFCTRGETAAGKPGVSKTFYDGRNLDALVRHCVNRLTRNFSNRDHQFLTLFMQHSLGRHVRTEFTAAQIAWLSSRPEQRVALEMVRHWQKRCEVVPDDSEVMLLALMFSQLHTPLSEHACHQHGYRLLSDIKQMVVHFQQLSALRFSDEQGLCAQLYTHLIQTPERSLCTIDIDNSLAEEMVRLYPRLLRTTRETVLYIEEGYNLCLLQQEIALIAIIFGALLEQEIEQQLRELTLLPQIS